ncbi:hypothetical protein CL647_03700 [bacterium]|nr:hypothetical protein [Actinomycetota bacterium]MBE33208.1 hypothetical protein [bacterium]|tara:strand:- start:785 stop:1480 length:696 start_codon:yes stop_codon:yes gene_type:complete
MSEKNKDEFEHNDGLGDLLREREKLEFSWSKTIVILCSLFAVVIVGIYFIFNIGRSVIQTEIKDTISSSKVASKKPASKIVKKIQPVKESVIANKTNKKTPAKQTKAKKIAKEVISKKPKRVVSRSVPKKIEKKIKIAANTSPKKKVSRTNERLQNTSYKVITGTFSNYDNAIAHLDTLKSNGIKGFVKESKTSLGSTFRVQVGAYTSRDSALRQQVKLNLIDIDSYIYQE